MGKVVDYIDSDEATLTQWIWRKLRNHDPMSVRDVAKRHANVRETMRVSDFDEEKNFIRYAMNDGRVFEITCKQVEGSTPNLAMVEED